jgi:hypothetical protein
MYKKKFNSCHFAIRIQDRCKMVTQLEECAGVSFNEICDNWSVGMQKKVQKDIPTTNLIRM